VEIEAKVGDTVELINKDIVAHTATVPGDWDVMIAANKVASLVLKKSVTLITIAAFIPT
jgi:plastocyanin